MPCGWMQVIKGRCLQETNICFSSLLLQYSLLQQQPLLKEMENCLCITALLLAAVLLTASGE